MALLAAAAIGGLAYFLHAQTTDTGGEGAAEESEASLALALEAINNPEAVAAALDAQATPEQLVAKEFGRWALENPGEFYERYVKTDPARAVPKEAEFAILNPVEATAQALQKMTPEQRAEEARIAYEIEHPTGN